MQKLSKIIAHYQLPILAGFLIGTSYIPFPPWASFFCFVPLWIFLLRAKNYKEAFIGGWITQFVLTMIGFNWVIYTVHEFGHMPWAVSLIALCLFASFANLYIPLAALIWFLLKKTENKLFALVLLAALTALFEAAIPTIFPWNYGYTFLWSQLPMAQTAELIGFQGLSSIIIFINVLSFFFWQNRKTKTGKLLFAHILGVFLIINLIGYVLKSRLTTPDRTAQILVTQANIGNLEKEYAEKGWGFREAIFTKYASLTRQALAHLPSPTGIDFVLWPETAYPFDMDQRHWSNETESQPFQVTYLEPAQNLLNLSRELNANLITGGYGFAPKDNKVTNTFFIIEKSGNIQPHPYYKTILLAFGEYIPGAEWFPQMKNWIPAGDFSRGFGPSIKKIKMSSGEELKIGPQICYESLYPEFSRGLANLGTEMIVNLTNDSWYGTWQEPYQHLYMTLGRAIEYRRPVVRATNTGISTVILANGQILAESPLNTEWTQLYKIPYLKDPPPTFYQKYPWLINALLISIILIMLRRMHFGLTQKS